MAPCSDGANRKPSPTSRSDRSTVSTGTSTRTPRPCRRSALPQRLLTERLPCLATTTPAAATTSADRVEMLNVPAPSPPVPHVSRITPASQRTRVDRSRMTRSEEHTSELQSLAYLVCRLLLE